jgi:ppGpp synthetase/RelA/SpoT-type nucleotidyltranferase
MVVNRGGDEAPRPERRVFTSWLTTHQPLLDEGRDELVREVGRFLRRLRDEHPLLHVEDPKQNARVKEERRILAKCTSREVNDPEELLCRLDGPADHEPPVGDLIGLRVLVRSLRDIEIIKDGLGEHHLGAPERMKLQDHNQHPTVTGYRALHVDGVIVVHQGDVDFGLPFEIQFKTLTQHVFGQVTHEDAYVRDQVNTHEDFDTVRRLQRNLASSLFAADEFIAEIEQLSRTLRERIAGQETGEEITAPGIEGVVRDLFDSALTEPEASASVRRADHAGIGTLSELRDLLNPDTERVQRAEKELRIMLPRPPSAQEILRDVLDQIIKERAEQRAAEELREQAEE